MLFVSDLPKKEKLEIYKTVKGYVLSEGTIEQLMPTMKEVLSEKAKDLDFGFYEGWYMETYKDYSYGRY